MPPIELTWMMWPEPCSRMIRQRRLCHPERTEEVRLELAADVGLAHLLDEAEVAVAGVVDDDVEPAEAIVRLLHGGEVRVAVGDVEGDRQDRVAVGLDEVVEGGGVAGGRGDVVASLECGDRPLATEPTGRSGDEPRFRHAFDAMTSSALQRKPRRRCQTPVRGDADAPRGPC